MTDCGLEGHVTVHRGIMIKTKQVARKTYCCTSKGMQEHIYKHTGTTYELSYVRHIMEKWGSAMKVPVLYHVNRANRRNIKKL